ncbi:MAG: hypothetical protein AVDCRST_MAG13-263, partial [uncultured Solirubrobacteraceae bacterium]
GGLAAVLVGRTLAAGATATGLIELDRGEGPAGPYTIVAAAPERDGSVVATFLGGGEDEVCLEVRRPQRRGAYGCGRAPTPSAPLGVLVVDGNAVPGRRLVLGLADERVAAVRTGGEEVRPTPRRGVPGRFFSLVTRGGGPVHVEAFDAAGRRVGELGSPDPLTRSPTSRDDARALGDPSGFAPTARPPGAFLYRGREIPLEEVVRRGLACSEDGTPVVRCEDP